MSVTKEEIDRAEKTLELRLLPFQREMLTAIMEGKTVVLGHRMGRSTIARVASQIMSERVGEGSVQA